MATAADKAALLGQQADTKVQQVEIEGFGAVTVRALSRADVLAMRGRELDVAEFEVAVLAMAMVDPAMTEDEVRQWQANSPAGQMTPVMEAASALSGLGTKPVKAALKSVGG